MSFDLSLIRLGLVQYIDFLLVSQEQLIESRLAREVYPTKTKYHHRTDLCVSAICK
jgi:hypothetical protein